MADSNAQQQLLEQFMSIAQCSEDKAHFFLSSHKWDLEAGLASFMELNDDADGGAASDAGPLEGGSQPATSGSASQPTSRQTGNVKSFRDFLDSNEEESDDEERENLYAGGEKSGIMMKGGPKKPAAADLVKNILEQAAKSQHAEHDHDHDHDSDEEMPAAPPPKPSFSGTGYRLGSEEEPAVNQPAVSDNAPSAQTGDSPTAESQARPETAVRHLTFWRNGFTIEDGPLLSYDDPQNQEFLQAIKTGRAPTKMLNVEFGQAVEVKVMQKLDEDFTPPPKVLKPFQGAGHKLGGVLSGREPSATATAPLVPSSFKLEVDSTNPVTTLQIRLADGTKLVAKFNHTHTIGDIRSFVAASTPGGASKPFQIMTTFPNKVLTDDVMSIADAGLLNAVIVQRT